MMHCSALQGNTRSVRWPVPESSYPIEDERVAGEAASGAVAAGRW
jgi:hypothetical protein